MVWSADMVMFFLGFLRTRLNILCVSLPTEHQQQLVFYNAFSILIDIENSVARPTDATRRNPFSTIFCFLFFHILTLTPEMGGDHLGPPISTQISKKVFRTRIVHTSVTIFEKSTKTSSKYVHIYRKRHRIRYTH